jgi:hypothetical protein
MAKSGASGQGARQRDDMDLEGRRSAAAVTKLVSCRFFRWLSALVGSENNIVFAFQFRCFPVIVDRGK